MRDRCRAGGTVVAAAVAILERQQHTLSGNRPFASAKVNSPPRSIVPSREDLQESSESRSQQTDSTDDEKTETRKRSPTETAKNNSLTEDATPGEQCEPGNTQEHASQQTKEHQTDLHDDKFESAVKDFDLVARDVENIVANSLKRAGKTTCKTEGDRELVVRAGDHVKAFSENDGYSDSSDYESSTTDSDSEREHVINEGLETITEEERNTNSSVQSFEGKRILTRDM